MEFSLSESSEHIKHWLHIRLRQRLFRPTDGLAVVKVTAVTGLLATRRSRLRTCPIRCRLNFNLFSGRPVKSENVRVTGLKNSYRPS